MSHQCDVADEVARLAIWKGWQCGKAGGMARRERERERCVKDVKDEREKFK